MTLGTSGRPEKGRPYSNVINTTPAQPFMEEYRKHFGYFDDHITCSIPGYREVQVLVGHAICRTFDKGGRMLDVGASEGSLIKAISATSRGAIQTIGLDPNYAMAETFNTVSSVVGASYCVAAFAAPGMAGKLAWVEDDFLDLVGQVPNPYRGRQIHYYDASGAPFDIVHACMVFQFMSDDRDAHVSISKTLLGPDGIFIIEEKVLTGEFAKNEDEKDLYKLTYFSIDDVAKKAKEVLSGNTGASMVQNMILDTELEDVLKSHFKCVVQFWDAGNFRGYIGSDSQVVIRQFLSNLFSTASVFAKLSTPRYLTEDEAQPSTAPLI